MTDPKCPSCGASGIDHIISQDSGKRSRNGGTSYKDIYRDSCGHVYAVFAKDVLNHEVKMPLQPFR
jgi:hypothetical protein